MKRRRPKHVSRPRPLCEPLDPRRLLTADPQWGPITAETSDVVVGPGAPLTVHAIMNAPWGTFSSYDVTRIYLSADDVPGGPDDVLVGQGSPWYTSVVYCNLPNNLPAPATYRLVATVDDQFATLGDPVNVVATTATPDLVPFPIGATPGPAILPASVFAGQVVTPVQTVANRGPDWAYTVITSVYLSPTPSLSPSATFLGTQTVPYVGPYGTTAYYSFPQVTIPRDLAPGTYYPIVSIDPSNYVTEADETNNVRVGPAVTVAAPSLDLSVVSATFDAATFRNPTRGDWAPLTVTLRNGSSRPATVGFNVSLSTDTTPDTADPVLFCNEQRTVAANSTQTVNVLVRVNSYPWLADGDYHLLVRATCDADPPASLSDSLLALPADYLVHHEFSAFTAAFASHSAGTTAPLAVRVNDRGNSSSRVEDVLELALYLSTDATLSPDDLLVGTRPVTSSNMFPWDLSIPLPATLAAGTYYPITVVDPGKKVAELDESNNTTVSSPFTLSPPGDIAPITVTAPRLVHANQWVSVPLTLSAANVPAAEQFAVRYVLTADDTVGNADDIVLGTVTHARPANSTAATLSFNDSLSLPYTLPLGNYRVGVILDPGHTLPETDETNNALLGPAVTVRIAAPDVVPSAPTVTLASDGSGFAPRADLTVSNLADLPATSVLISLYVSADPTLSDDDVLVGTTTNNATYYLGGTYPVQVYLSDLPNTLGATWYPIVRVSLTNVSADADPSNDVAVGQPFTTPSVRSLTLDALTLPYSPGPFLPGTGYTYPRLDVRAAGYFPSDAVKVRYYLTTDSTLDPTTDRFLQTVSYSILTGPSATPLAVSLDGYLQFPLGIPAGTYHLAAVLDGDPSATPVIGPDVTVVVPDPAASGLTVTAPRGSGSVARTGDYATASYTLSNPTATDATDVRVKIYLSADATLSPDDAVVWDQTFWNVPAHSAAQQAAAFPVPVAAGTRTYYPILVIDPEHASPDADRSNNVVVAGPITVVTPHFTLVSLSTPATVGNGGAFTVTGTALVTGFTGSEGNINFNLSLTDGTTNISSATLGPPPSAFDTGDATTPVLIPFSFTFEGYASNLRPGAYTLAASPTYWNPYADGTTIDVDPSFVAPAVTVTAADTYYLSLSAPAFAGPVYYSEPATISVTVTNLGGQPSPATTVSLSAADGYAYPWWYPAQPETALDPITIESIPAGASRTITVTRSLPSIRSFSGQLHFKTDAAAPIFFDPGPSHDAYLSYTATYHMPDWPPVINPPVINPPDVDRPVYTPPIDDPWWPPTYADPTLFAVSSPASVTAGSALRVFTTPTPAVGISFYAVPFDVAYVLSANDTVGDADDIVLGTAHFTGTESGQARGAFAVPAGTAPGTYRLFAVIDPDNVIAETSEDNNVLAGSAVTVVPPALAGTLTAPSLRVGAAARLNLSLANAPGQPAARRKFTVSYYLSSDPVFSPDDTLFSKQTIDTTLAAGGKAKSFPLTAKIPTTAPVGTRHLIAVVDAATGPKAHLELASKPLTVLGPHLTPVIQIVAGTTRLDTSKVTVRLLNDGTAPSAGGPITLRLLADGAPVLTTKVTAPPVKPGKYRDFTFTVRRSALSTYAVTLV